MPDEEASQEPEVDEANMLYPYYEPVMSLYGYMNRDGRTIKAPQWSVAGQFSDGLALVRKGLKYGYIGLDGELVYEPQFTYASDFSGGTARVDGDDGLAIITTDGSMLTGLQSVEWDTPEGMCSYMKNDLRGFAGQGRILDPIWKGVRAFSDGLAAVMDAETRRYGYINTAGELVIPYQFGHVSPFLGGYAYARIADYYDIAAEGGSWRGFIDKHGDLALPDIPAEGIALGGFSDGLALCNSDEAGGYHYIDQVGRIAIGGPFKHADPFEDGSAKVTYANGGVQLIDVRGEAISERYDAISAFSEGLACASKDERYGFIDRKGDVVLPQDYSAVVSGFQNGLALVEGDGERMYIDKAGQVVRKWAWPSAAFKQTKRQGASIDLSKYVSIGGSIHHQDRFPVQRQGSSGPIVEAAQQLLIELGFLSGSADGDFGPQTQRAVNDFQDRNGLERTGALDFDTCRQLVYPSAKGK